MPTPLKNLFLKPIERTIEGVIKADDNQSLRQEIEEYVLTNEVAKRLEDFLSAYLNYAGANGVWISGFFGSGKSHLLKILAHLLENKSVEGTPVRDLFLPKCPEDNALLKKDLMRAVEIPSQSILFNIDQKADIISKTQIDALLTVFVKVFDETCGYYGKQGHIAQFERDLDSRKQFVPFKQAFQALAGLPWERGREQALLEAKNIAQAYAEVTGDTVSAVGILDKYRAEYKVSIEDFADKVNAFLEQHPPNFRLNFFVDEVGQYISDNTKLMTNLQTIAESLATRCKGRAWILVTAQEDMHTVMGEMTQKQGNDFTKIQARFANRMKLTSQDVAEVIQKRLLAKNEAGTKIATALYQKEVNNLKTLFDFSDNSTTYRNFRDQSQFVDCYPFVPYQFPLFQSAIQALSEHNAFEGRHSSVGERSMLGVFKQVAEKISQHEPGQLASFDLMYEGLSTALKSNNKRAIDHVEKHLDNPMALRLIKVLFLVKYIKGFKASLHNLSVLLLDHFEADLPQLRKSIEAALLLLEQQTLIQRNGELYEFLTDEEKDIEQEIKNQEVDQSKVAEELKTLCFDSVLKVSNKIRFIDNGQDYPFAKKLDDQLFGKDSELTLHLISPFHEHATDETLLQMQNMGRNELLVVMPADDRLMRDLWLYARTDKYLRQNLSTAQQDNVKQILTNKKLQNGNRLADLQKLVESLLGKARMFVAGNAIEESSEQAQTRIFKGFYALINRTYPNLKMLRGVSYNERDLGSYLNPDKNGLLGGDYDPISEAEQEMLAFVQSNQSQNLRTSVKAVIERFERKPYLIIRPPLCVRSSAR
jgi:energy-coupling factor transporter ATP-binding protein EcfA2